jgi:hypothetical protein
MAEGGHLPLKHGAHVYPSQHVLNLSFLETAGGVDIFMLGTVMHGLTAANANLPVLVDDGGRLQVDVIDGGGGGITDDSAFGIGSDNVSATGALFDDVSPDSVDEGDVGILRMSDNRNLYVQVRDAAGNERGINVDADGDIGVNVNDGSGTAITSTGVDDDQGLDVNVINPSGANATQNLDIARSLVSGLAYEHKFGRLDDVDLTFEEIWDGNAAYAYQTAAQSMEVVSSSANDATGGTGARTVQVFGLDSDYVLQNATVGLNGVTAVALPSTWIRVFRAIVRSAGSGAANAGDIDVQVASGGAIQATILTGNNQTLMALYTVPANTTAYLLQWYFTGDGNATIDAKLLVRPDGEVFQIKEVATTVGAPFRYPFMAIIELPAKADIKIEAKSSVANTEVEAGFDIVLVTGALGTGSSLNDDIVAFWKLGEAAGSLRVDSVTGYNLSENNGPISQATGKIGNAVQLTSASSHFLNTSDTDDLSAGSTDITIAAWVYLDSLGTMTYASKWLNTGSNFEYAMQHDSGNNRFRFFVSSNGSGFTDLVGSSSGAISTATWYFVVMWFDTAAQTIYIQVNNGTVDSKNIAVSALHDGTADFLISGINNGGAQLFNGRVDAVGVWRRVLTTSERSELYNSGTGAQYPF